MAVYVGGLKISDELILYFRVVYTTGFALSFIVSCICWIAGIKILKSVAFEDWMPPIGSVGVVATALAIAPFANFVAAWICPQVLLEAWRSGQ